MSSSPDTSSPATGKTARARRAARAADPELAQRVPVPADDLMALLEDLHKSATLLHRNNAPALEAAIAQLECELAARGITLPAFVEEPMPHRIAFDLFMTSLGTRDRDGAARAIRNLPDGALWLAARRSRELCDTGFRIHCLSQVLYRLDLGFLDLRSAVARQKSIANSGLDTHDLEAFVEQGLASMFGVVFSQGPFPGEDQDAR